MAREFEVLLTASEAYPALEREFLNATDNVSAGFRIFDPWTKLRSNEGRAIGETWFDLLVHTLDRGVAIRLIVTDFDPVVRFKDHVYTWGCLRAVIAAGEASANPDLLYARTTMHPARVGLLPRLLLWPRLVKEINTALSDVNEQPMTKRLALLDRAPYLRKIVIMRGKKLRARRAPPPPLVPVTHHQKLAVFDDTRLYIGGLDLNDRRYDTLTHERDAEETWHDAQVIVDGPAATEAATHLRDFRECTRGKKPAKAKHFLRTLSAKRRFEFPFLSPREVLTELADAHISRIAKAETFIYMESQFFRDTDLAEALAQRAKAMPDLTMILILPARPEEAAFEEEPSSDVAYGEKLQTQAIETIREAFGDRVFIGSPAQLRSTSRTGGAVLYGAPIIYLHAKVSIFDRSHAIVSSANLNGRSMAWDTEAGIQTQNKDEAEILFKRCVDHWLGQDADDVYRDSATAQGAWARLAAENVTRKPEDRRGYILPYDVAPADKFGSNLPGVPEEMV